MIRKYTVQGACVDVECLVMGLLENNVYLIGDGTGHVRGGSHVQRACHP